MTIMRVTSVSAMEQVSDLCEYLAAIFEATIGRHRSDVKTRGYL